MNNQRLEYIADIFRNKNIIDVGSDHGYLPLYLFKQKKIIGAVVVEVNEVPLENAKRNFKYQKQNADFYLSDGLIKFDKQIKPDTGVVIAGMGGNLIAKIIGDSIEKFQKITTLYLQPNNNEYKLRNYLSENGFEISSNHLVKDDGIIYEVITAKYLGKVMNYTKEELFFGRDQLQEDLFKEKWISELNYKNNLNKKINENNHKNEKLEKEIEMINLKLGEQ